MAAPAVRAALDERGAAPSAALVDGPARHLVDLGYVVAVDRVRRQTEGGSTPSDALACRDGGGRRELRVTVVLADEKDGCLPQHGEVQRLEEDALVCRAVAEERHGDRFAPEPLRGEREPNRVGDPPADNAVCAYCAFRRGAHVHGPALAAAVAA